jgi:hypothetical protein
VVSQKPKMTDFSLPETKSAGDLRFAIYDLRAALRDENCARIGVGMTAKRHKRRKSGSRDLQKWMHLGTMNRFCSGAGWKPAPLPGFRERRKAKARI